MTWSTVLPRATEQDGRYPRPQLVRAAWTDLDGPWDFAFDDDDHGLAERWMSGGEFPLTIEVPFCFETRASGIGDGTVHPIVWYRRALEVEVEPGERALVHFGAVDYEAQVWANGIHVGSHVGGQTRFTVDITDALTGSDVEIVVRAFDEPDRHDLPRGKQDWQPEPHHIWYRRTTGIWRSVWLETVPALHIRRLTWRVSLDENTVTAELQLSARPPAGTQARLLIERAGVVLAEASVSATTTAVKIPLEIPVLRNALERRDWLWSPEKPRLLDAQVHLSSGGVRDEVASYLGLRTVEVQGGALVLNHADYQLRGVLEQGYWDDSQFTPPNAEALRREVELIKELGFTWARIHQKTEDPRFLYWADRLGLAIWAETASPYEFTPDGAAALMHEWVEIVEQQRNHPSIVAWVPVNESWGVRDLARRSDQRAFVQALASLTRALDDSRPVISNDGWEHVDSDILTVHDYDDDPGALVQRFSGATDWRRVRPWGRALAVSEQMYERAGSLPLMLTEFGGIAFAAEGDWGYVSVTTTAEYQHRLEALFGALHSAQGFAGWCYTQLTDTMQEANGLLTSSREPKLPIETIRSIVVGAG